MRIRVGYSGLICATALVAGCQTIGRQTIEPEAQAVQPSSDERTTQLPRDDERVLSTESLALACALGDYAFGLTLESDPARAEEALEAFRRSAENAPDYHEPLVGAARVLLGLGRTRESLEAQRQAAVLKADDVRVWTDLASIEELSGSAENALRAYERLIELAPTNGEWYVHSVRLNLALDRHDAALETLRRGARDCSRPDAIAALTVEAGRHLLAGEAPLRAIPFFNFFIELRPAAGLDVRLSLADVFRQLVSEDAAIEQYRLAIEASPSHPLPRIRLAGALAARDGVPAAIAELESGLNLLPSNLAYLETLAFLHTLNSNPVPALLHYETIERLTAEGVSAQAFGERFYRHYAIALEQTGRIGEAETVLERGIAALPQSHSLLNHLAYLWAENDRALDRALDYVRKALEAEPDNGAYIDTLGWIYYRQKRFEEALAEVERAHRILGDDPVILDHLGDIHEALGNVPVAIEQWRLSFGAYPTPGVRAKLETHGIQADALAPPAPEETVKPDGPEPEN